MDGFTAARSIREAERETRAHLPLIAVTAHAMKGDRERCLAEGFDGCVVKPIDVETLFAEIERLVPDARAILTTSVPPPLARLDSRPVHREPARAAPPAAFDPGVGVKRAGDDVALARDLAGLFLDECPRWLAQLTDALAQGDAAAATRAAHTIKGGVDHWGAARAFDLALRLERLARDQKLARARDLLPELTRELDELMPALRGFAAGA